MNYDIIGGDSYPVLEVDLQPGDEIVAVGGKPVASQCTLQLEGDGRVSPVELQAAAGAAANGASS